MALFVGGLEDQGSISAGDCTCLKILVYIKNTLLMLTYI